MTIIDKSIDELKPYENNPRQNMAAVPKIRESIVRYGFKVPLVIDQDGVIVCGHTRYKAAKDLGLKTVPCIVADDLTPELIKEFRLVENKTAEYASWDEEKLRFELKELNFACEEFGFDVPELDIDTDASGADDGLEEEPEEDEAEDNRRLLNLDIANFPGVGPYGIPELLPEEYEPMPFIPFSEAASFTGEAAKTGVHFFIDDYRFIRVWNNPRQQVKVLRRFGCVLTPDFSLYMNTPKAIQIFNHYRKHWCGAFWESAGIKVIPTLCWSDKESFAWCFDGEPIGGTVAVSSVGVMASPETQELFLAGYEEMKKRLMPTTILHYGKPIEAIASEVIELEAFQARFDRLRKR